jgi:hypothetical protein
MPHLTALKTIEEGDKDQPEIQVEKPPREAAE